MIACFGRVFTIPAVELLRFLVVRVVVDVSRVMAINASAESQQHDRK